MGETELSEAARRHVAAHLLALPLEQVVVQHDASARVGLGLPEGLGVLQHTVRREERLVDGGDGGPLGRACLVAPVERRCE